MYNTNLQSTSAMLTIKKVQLIVVRKTEAPTLYSLTEEERRGVSTEPLSVRDAAG